MSEELIDTEVTCQVIGDDGKGGTNFVMKVNGEEIPVSRQIFEDSFNYDLNHCIQPIYSFDALLYFFENNTWHSRCCRLKAACTVGLGYNMILRKRKEDDLKELEKLEEFFESCNAKETFLEIMNKVQIDYESTGNGYIEVIRNLKGDIIGFFHIPAHTMRVRRNQDGFVQLRDARYVFYKNFGDTDIYDTKGIKQVALPIGQRASEVIHLAQYSPRSSFYGIPEWLPAMSAMFASEKAEDFNIQFFENNAVPQFAIIVKKAKLGSDTKTVIADYFKKHIKAKNHKTLVLEVPGEGELEMKELAKDSKDSSFRLYRLDNRDEVIASHGVPPRMVGIVSAGSLGGTGESAGQKESFLTQIIGPRQASLNHRMNKIISTNGIGAQSYRFAFIELNWSDDTADSKIFETYIKLGVYSINDVRDKLREARLDVTKFPGANEYFIFTSSGPILISKLLEYMDAALMPTQPSPPGLPGGASGKSTETSTKNKNGVTKLISELIEIRKELQDELEKTRTSTVNEDD